MVAKLLGKELDQAPPVVGHIELPTPFVPRSSAFRREAADRLRDLLVTAGVEVQDSPEGSRWALDS